MEDPDEWESLDTFPSKRKKAKRKKRGCCDYSLDIEEALAYDEINSRAGRAVRQG
jgi:hypothetical protein